MQAAHLRRTILLAGIAALCLSGRSSAQPVTASVGDGQSTTLPNFTRPVLPDSTIRGQALASVAKVVTLETPSLLKTNGTNGDTGLAEDKGTIPKITDAKAEAKFAISGQNVLFVGTAGSAASVDAGRQLGTAGLAIFDPAHYANAGGVTFAFDYGLTGGAFSIQATTGGLLPSSGALASASIHTDAGSNIPGLESFFTLDFTLDGSDPSALGVTFRSNPLLGLNDVGIESLIRSDLAYDPGSGRYSLTSSLTYAHVSVTVPAGQDSALFTWNTSAHVSGIEPSAVPEPASLVLTGMAATILAAVVARGELRRHSA